MTQEAELAYVAGFFDGEGSIGIKRKETTFAMFVTASQLDKRPLEMLQRLFGGHLKKKQKESGCYAWGATTQQAANALRAMLPYLIVKKAQAELAIEFQERRIPGGIGKRDFGAKVLDAADYQQMRELKKLARAA